MLILPWMLFSYPSFSYQRSVSFPHLFCPFRFNHTFSCAHEHRLVAKISKEHSWSNSCFDSSDSIFCRWNGHFRWWRCRNIAGLLPQCFIIMFTSSNRHPCILVYLPFISPTIFGKWLHLFVWFKVKTNLNNRNYPQCLLDFEHHWAHIYCRPNWHSYRAFSSIIELIFIADLIGIHFEHSRASLS